jgi:phosphoserine phosphatase
MPQRSAAARHGPLRLVAFDMDGVLIDHVSSWAAVHDELGTDNAAAIQAFARGAIDDREFILADVRLWRSARPELDARQLRAILARVPRMTGLVEAVAKVRAAGAVAAIISGGLRPMAEIVAQEAGIAHVRANDVVFGADGRLADDAVVEVPLRGKAGVLRSLQQRLGIGPAQTASVGDSLFDVGLFRRSARSVAFNPLDAAVAAGAWRVVHGKDLRRAVAALFDGEEEMGWPSGATH